MSRWVSLDEDEGILRDWRRMVPPWTTGVVAVGADFAGVAPGVDGEERDLEGGCQVHGAAIDADDRAGGTEVIDQFDEAWSDW